MCFFIRNVIRKKGVMGMREENRVKKDLTDLCGQFIEMMDNLKKQGIIDQNEYQKLVENKKRFIRDQGRKDISEKTYK